MGQQVGKKKIGGLKGREELTCMDIDGTTYVASIQDIVDLVPNPIIPPEFILENGSGTTANGSAINLGGVLDSNTTINFNAGYLKFIDSEDNELTISRNGLTSYFGNNDVFGQYNVASNQISLENRNYSGDGYGAYIGGESQTSAANLDLIVFKDSPSTILSLNINTTLGIIFNDTLGKGIHMPDLKSGISQTNAGAVEHELWYNTLSNSIQIGVASALTTERRSVNFYTTQETMFVAHTAMSFINVSLSSHISALEYSINDGSTWNDTDLPTTPIVLTLGNEIIFRVKTYVGANTYGEASLVVTF